MIDNFEQFKSTLSKLIYTTIYNSIYNAIYIETYKIYKIRNLSNRN